MSILLCGLPGCGKTTVGQRLAQTLSWQFIDIDRSVEEAYGKPLTCRQIFQLVGESHFRQLEKKQLEAVLGKSQTVIALGGGSLLDSCMANALATSGWLVYLKIDAHLLWQRLQKKELPAFLPKEDTERAFYALAVERSAQYEKHAHATMDINHKTSEVIVDSLLASLKFANPVLTHLNSKALWQATP